MNIYLVVTMIDGVEKVCEAYADCSQAHKACSKYEYWAGVMVFELCGFTALAGGKE